MKTHKYHPHLWLKFLKCCSVNEKIKHSHLKFALYQKMDKYKTGSGRSCSVKNCSNNAKKLYVWDNTL